MTKKPNLPIARDAKNAVTSRGGENLPAIIDRPHPLHGLDSDAEGSASARCAAWSLPVSRPSSSLLAAFRLGLLDEAQQRLGRKRHDRSRFETQDRQPLRGGILKRLLVQEGDRVAAGQPLVKLEDTRARSDLQALQSRRLGLIAKLARLRAEQTDSQEITFPDDLKGAPDPAADDAVKAETNFFERRREAKAGRLDVQGKTIEEFSEKAKSLAEQIRATDRQIELITEQRTAIATLVAKEFAQRSKLIEIDAKLSELAATRGELAGNKAQAEKAEAGAELGLTGIENEFQSEIAGEITTARLELSDVEERLVSAKDILTRLDIRSPQAGIVTNIQLRTAGSAVSAGQPLLDIVPEDEPLLVEMHVGTRDIDSIDIGSKTQIRLTAYNQRTHLPLDGEISYVAADQSVDEKSNVSYYVARARIAASSLSANPDIRLYPGMPAEVLIVHKPRSAIDYMVSPIADSLNRAFRED